MRLFFLFLCSLWFIPGTALAWGARGHIVVAEIAEANLTQSELAKVRAILSHDPNPSIGGYRRGPLASVATWADEIRSSGDMPANAAKWHYRNNSVCSARVGACKGGDCIDAKIEEMIRVLRNPDATGGDKAVALKWLVHLVGDIHQPLHVGDNGDRGGNSMTVALAGSRTRGRISLHKAWDTNLVDLTLEDYPMTALRSTSNMNLGSPAVWMDEGRAIAQKVVYGHLPGFTCGQAQLPPIVLLTAEYQYRAKTVIAERLQIAGLRLAAVLRNVLA